MRGNFTKDRKPTPAHPKEVDALQQSVASLMASISEEKRGDIQFLVDLVREFKKDMSLTEDAREVKVVNQFVLTHRDYLKKLISKDTTTIEELGQIVDMTGVDLSAISKNLNLAKKKVIGLVDKLIRRVKVEDKIEVSYKPKVNTLYKVLESKIAGEQYFKNVSEFCEKRIREKLDDEIDKLDKSNVFGDVSKNKTKSGKKSSRTSGRIVQSRRRENITNRVLRIDKDGKQRKGSVRDKKPSVFGKVGPTLVKPQSKRRISIPTIPTFGKKKRRNVRTDGAVQPRTRTQRTRNLISSQETVFSIRKDKKIYNLESHGSKGGKTTSAVSKPEYRNKKRTASAISIPEHKDKKRSIGFVNLIPFLKKEKKGKTVSEDFAVKKITDDNTSFKYNFMVGFDSTLKFIGSTMIGIMKKIPGMVLRGVLAGAKWAIFQVIKLVCPVAGFILKLLKPFMFLLKWVGKGAKLAFKAVGAALSFSFGVIKKTLWFATVGWIKGLFGIHKKIMKILKSNIVKKIIGFLFSPKGAFVLGFIAGFLYKHVYLPIKRNWQKIKRYAKIAYLKTKTAMLKGLLAIGSFYNTVFVPGYQKMREFVNDLDVEKIDQMALDFKMRVWYPMVDIFDFLKETIMDVPSLAGSAIGAAVGSFFGPIGTIAGGLIGGLIGGLVTDAFGDKFKKELDERTKRENRERDVVASYGFSEKTNRRKNIIAEAMKRKEHMSDEDLKKNQSELQKLNKMNDANRYFMNTDEDEGVPEDFDVGKLGEQINEELTETKNLINDGGLDKSLEEKKESKIPLPGNVPYKGLLLHRYVRAILLSRMYNLFRDEMITKSDFYRYYSNIVGDDGFSKAVLDETLNTYTINPNTGAKQEKKMTVQQVLEGDFYSFKDRNGNKILSTSGLVARGQLLNMEGETHEQSKGDVQSKKVNVDSAISRFWTTIFNGIPVESQSEAHEILRNFMLKSYSSDRWKKDGNGNLVFGRENAEELNRNLKDLFQTVELYNEQLKSHKFVHMPNLPGGMVDLENIRKLADASQSELDVMLKEDKLAEENKKQKMENELNESGDGMVSTVLENVAEKVKNRKKNQSVVIQNNKRSDLFATK